MPICQGFREDSSCPVASHHASPEALAVTLDALHRLVVNDAPKLAAQEERLRRQIDAAREE